jgi:AcrR family transcriptional regulator
LQNPRGERVTTAALAAKIGVSEAALYRHFASKAQMFEGLIAFIEQTVFGLINQINQKEEMGTGTSEGHCTNALSLCRKESLVWCEFYWVTLYCKKMTVCKNELIR